MIHTIKYTLVLLFFQSMLHVQASALIKAQIALPSSMPPYIIAHTQSGIILDIIKSIYPENRYALEFSFFPNPRLIKEFQNKNYLTAFAIPRKEYNEKIYYSNAIVEFKNIAISLKKNNLTINNISHLSNKSITAFQSAAKFLGDSYKKMTLSNPHYDEVTDQRSQLQLLVKGRTDVIVMEERIFWYHFKQLHFDHTIKEKFRFHPVFKSKSRYCAFYDKDQRDSFNINLNQLRQSNSYHAIINKYLSTH